MNTARARETDQEREDRNRKAVAAARADWTWLRCLSADTLSNLRTSRPGDDRTRMIEQYLRSRYTIRQIKAAKRLGS